MFAVDLVALKIELTFSFVTFSVGNLTFSLLGPKVTVEFDERRVSP